MRHIVEGIAGDPTFAACKSKNGQRQAINGVRKVIYGRRPGQVSPSGTPVAAGNTVPLRESPSRPPIPPKSRVDTVCDVLRELQVPEERIAKTVLDMAHALEKDNNELRGLYAKERKEKMSAWTAVAEGRGREDVLTKKIKGDATVFPSLNKEKHLVAFGE